MAFELTNPNARFRTWPREVPLPTEAEYLAAKARFDKQPRPDWLPPADRDFARVMATCATFLTWWHFFFPDQRVACLEEIQRQMYPSPPKPIPFTSFKDN